MSISPPCYKQNRLKQLRAFCKAVETRSISKAGEALFLSQPTVSLQIRALERELCVQVFERRATDSCSWLNGHEAHGFEWMDSIRKRLTLHSHVEVLSGPRETR